MAYELRLQMVNKHGANVFAMWANNAMVNDQWEVMKLLGNAAYASKKIATGGFVFGTLPKTHVVQAGIDDFVFFDPALVGA